MRAPRHRIFTDAKETPDVTLPDDRRSALLDRLADYVLAEGISAASLRRLARAADTSDRMLLYYFTDKADVIAATLDHVSARLVTRLEERTARVPLPLDRLCRDLARILFTDDMWPFMRLWLEIAALAGRGDPVYRDLGERLGRGFLDWGAAQLDSPDPEARAADAARLFVMMEGTLLLKSVGMDDIAARAVRTVE